MKNKYSRRNFIKTSLISGTAMCFWPTFSKASVENNRRVKLGIIGTGLRGQAHIDVLLQRDDVDIIAICDIQQRMINDALQLFVQKGKAKPLVFSENELVYRQLLALTQLEGVIIATPWEWHYQMGMDSMQAGKFVGCEVVAAHTLKEHWNLIKMYEKTKTPYMILENVCYRRDVLAVLNMVRNGVFGELIHLQGGYQHDLRAILFNDGKQPYGGGLKFGQQAFSEAQWRTNHYIDRNGDLYPGHGIGPLAMMADINRNNRFTSLVSYSSKAKGLHDYVVKQGGIDHPNASVNFEQGDVVTTMIRCYNGETILLQFDTSLPRPYSLGFRVQGTNGIWMDVNKSIYIEDQSGKAHSWESADKWLSKYDHPLWQKYSLQSNAAGHGGMDFFVIHAFVECVKRKLNPPLDIYDAVTWSAITPLSEESVKHGGKNIDFPDFSRGVWKGRKNDFALTDDY